MQLLTHTTRQTKLVEEAADNRLLFKAIQMVAGSQHSEPDSEEMDGNGVLSRPTSCSFISTLSFIGKPDSSYKEQQQVDSQHVCLALHSWDTEILRYSGDPPSLKTFIQSLPPEALIKKDVQNRTICHALCGLCGHLFLLTQTTSLNNY